MLQDYLKELKKSWHGEIRTDFATRLTLATDNSIYQVLPEAVIFPKDSNDLATALSLAAVEKFQGLTFSPRGGGTGTNGQSLSAGIIIDCSKYMREILEVNVEEKWVRVQPGVIPDQLNEYVRKYNLHFAPEISPSNRATLGGMINTDACGMGSAVIGRTSDHIVDLTLVLADGAIINSTGLLSPEDLASATTKHSRYQNIIAALANLFAPHASLIKEKFISRPRNLTGYNLLKSYQDNKIHLNYLFSGSEGTLGIVAEAKLKLTSLPTFKKCILVKYKTLEDALKAYSLLEKVKPTVIEVIDEKLLALARQDALYFQIQNIIDGNVAAGAINIIEFLGDDESLLQKQVNDLLTLEKNAIGFYQAKNDAEINLLWDLRKKSVGLISKKNIAGRRPIPFVEDTAVPPENLASYISEFKSLLDKHQLAYGMYGHVDAGCVHVRPALDLKRDADDKLFQSISDEVVKLLEKYNGVMWGEHGMGYRVHYAEHFFGKELAAVNQKIKKIFDPHNKLNPGKVAVPYEKENNLVQINGPLRGKLDKAVSKDIQNEFSTVMACNGNGACFSFRSAETMCPSYKVTKNRIHSPKGRAVLMREWLRLFSLKKTHPHFNKEIYTAMNGCLSCKACTAQCPLNVDVPSFKSKFLFQYHKKHSRPLRDYFIGSLETTAPLCAQIYFLVNVFLKLSLIKFIFKKLIKLIDLPLFSGLTIEKRKHPFFSKHPLLPPYVTLSEKHKANSIILLQDAFTSFYENEVAIKIYDFLKTLGLTVFVLPFFPSGKPKQVKGFLNQFEKIARKNSYYLSEIAKSTIPMIGIDPSITLMYRDEYQKLAGNDGVGFKVQLIQEWLSANLATLKISKAKENKIYFLLSHCTEKTNAPQSEKQWQKIFEAFGLTLQVLPAGCCGMAGAYGHEVEHVENSRELFSYDWERYLKEIPASEQVVLATGYSCRSQIDRFTGIKISHPVEVLLN